MNNSVTSTFCQHGRKQKEPQDTSNDLLQAIPIHRSSEVLRSLSCERSRGPWRSSGRGEQVDEEEEKLV